MTPNETPERQGHIEPNYVSAPEMFGPNKRGGWDEDADETGESLAARIGNWNDRRSGHDSRAVAGWLWRVIDRVVSWLYVRGF